MRIHRGESQPCGYVGELSHNGARKRVESYRSGSKDEYSDYTPPLEPNSYPPYIPTGVPTNDIVSDVETYLGKTPVRESLYPSPSVAVAADINTEALPLQVRKSRANLYGVLGIITGILLLPFIPIMFGLLAWKQIGITGVGSRALATIAVILGFPMALLFAWILLVQVVA